MNLVTRFRRPLLIHNVRVPLREGFHSLLLHSAQNGLGKFLAITWQLGLVLLVCHVFSLEESYGFQKILPLLFFGFIINAGLSLRYRLPFFLLLTLVALLIILSPFHVIEFIAIGLCLIGICHLPIAYQGRIALLLIAGALLIALRAEWIQTPLESLPRLVLPLIGTMFMFRLVIYMYDLRHEKKPASIWERLSYFFLLPNVVFPLFPVVDYQTFRRTYYDTASHEIYQKGVLWMLRGVMHLLLYRLINYHFTLSPAEVQDLGGVVQFMLSTYLLYLRISGQFHLIVGILCLFGFNLPETHHLYLLSSSFNDYWRRINIYWKDFMMKIFYYPAFMKLRRRGTLTAMVAATLIVFVATWSLHIYQWFWLRGSLLLTAPDVIFWGILGGLVVINSLYEAKRGRKRSLIKPAWTVRGAFLHSLKTMGMFLFICVLWSLWSSKSVGEWVSMVSMAGNSGVADFALLTMAFASLVVVGVLIQWLMSRGWSLTLTGNHPSFMRSAILTSSVALLFVLMGLIKVESRRESPAMKLLASIQTERISLREEEQWDRGYYEGLLDMERYTTALATAREGRPEDWRGIRSAEAVRKSDGVLEYELIPLYQGTLMRVPFQTNRWGMRDKEYERKKPPQTYRIAMLGASYGMGAGVENGEIFESVLEDRLNREHAGEPYAKYEILNFAVAGYSVVQNLIVTEEKLFLFEPDIVLYAGHTRERQRLIAHVTNVVQKEVTVRHQFLREILEKSGVKSSMTESEIRRRFAPFADEIVQWGYQTIVEVCHQRGVVPVWIFVPLTEETKGVDQDQLARISQFAREAGFVTLSLEGAYGAHDATQIRVAPWDTHPSVKGHRLIAERLYQVLRENEQVFQLGLSTQGTKTITSP